jgi:hypothetical protein
MHALIFAALVSAQPLDETVSAVDTIAVPLKDPERLDGKLVVTAFRAPETSGWCGVCWACQRTTRV